MHANTQRQLLILSYTYNYTIIYIQHNTFQGIVITNGTKTYTVFTYRCDDIQWANGNSTVIGFNAGGTYYVNHPLSATPEASDIDCQRSPLSIWNNIVYDVNPMGSNISISPPLGGMLICIIL